MRKDILDANPGSVMRVYAIWLPMLFSDDRGDWNPDLLDDARVISIWDGDALSGRWFAEHVEGFDGVVWDAYYLFGPEAVWAETPGPIVSSGATIFGERHKLQAALADLLD